MQLINSNFKRRKGLGALLLKTWLIKPTAVFHQLRMSLYISRVLKIIIKETVRKDTTSTIFLII